MAEPHPTRLLLLATAALAATGNACAGWYFVAPDGSDGAAGRSMHAPLETIQKALELARPGDTVVLQPGIYDQDFKTVRTGRPDSPIRVQGPSDAVVRGGGDAYVAEIRHSYVELSGFTIDGHFGAEETEADFRDKLVYIQGPNDRKKRNSGITGIRVTGMRLVNARGECLRLKNSAQRNEIAHNTIARCGLGYYRFDGQVKNGEAIYIGGSSKNIERRRGDESTGNHIHHNLIRQVGECIDIKEGAGRNLVEHNICAGALDPDSGGISVRSNHNIIRYNVVDSGTGVGVRLGGHADDDGTRNQVTENQLQYNREGALKIMRLPQARVCGNEIRQPSGLPDVRFGDAGIMPIRESCSKQDADTQP